jgi:serine/threonine-protein kinase
MMEGCLDRGALGAPHVNSTPYSSPHAPTLDAIDVRADSLSCSLSPAACRVALVEGSTPELSAEIQSLLRSRLRIAAILLAIGFGAFFVRSIFLVQFDRPLEVTLWILNGGVFAILGVLGAGLCRRCPMSTAKLRLTELVIFGLPALYFLGASTVSMMALHREEFSPPTAYLKFPGQEFVSGELVSDGTQPARPGGQNRLTENACLPWIMLTFVYAMYIPNTWRRAAVIIGSLSAIPIISNLAGILASESVARAVTWNGWIGIVLVMSLSAVSGVWGVQTIGRLRSEAFEARQLGQYRLTHLIGSGGMGEVYLAEHQLMKRPVAIKVIRPHRATDPSALARFEREVRATSRLSHWNTIEIFDYGRTADGTFYYVMEYLPGMSIAELVERHGPLAPERVVYLLSQTCDALGEAHSLGLIHRDIKPGNIFAAERGGHYDVAKLLDFGLAKRTISADESIQLTSEGSVTGSPLYMSPEQVTGEAEADARSDIYALGAVAYLMLTGRPPFPGENAIKVMIAHASQEVTPPSQLRPDIPADLEAIVLRCLAKHPADRFQDAASLAAALAACECAGAWTREHAARWWASIDKPALSPQKTVEAFETAGVA